MRPSLFEFEVYGDEKFGSDQCGQLSPSPQQQQQQQQQQSGHGGGISQLNQSRFRSEKPTGGKLEKSFVSFRQAHPNYEGNAAGMSMLKRLDAYKDMQ